MNVRITSLIYVNREDYYNGSADVDVPADRTECRYSQAETYSIVSNIL